MTFVPTLSQKTNSDMRRFRKNVGAGVKNQILERIISASPLKTAFP